ncbi:MAG TPA: hypothetical protein PKI14_17665 [Fervidobacterium sp.]|nr:hypothetical protein [Fervidobacterium sp.]
MAKPFYADYVNHMLRFYARTVKSEDVMGLKFTSEVDELNWRSVNRVLHNLPELDKYIIIEVFGRGDTLADNIYEVSKEVVINQDVIWTMLSKITYQIAKERGLV